MAEPKYIVVGEDNRITRYRSVRARLLFARPTTRRRIMAQMRKFKPVNTQNGESGTGVEVRFVGKGNEHIANDIKNKNTKNLLSSDVSDIPALLKNATYVKSEPNTKVGKGSKFKQSIERFHYYKAIVREKEVYFNVGTVVNRRKNGAINTYNVLYAVTDKIKTT